MEDSYSRIKEYTYRDNERLAVAYSHNKDPEIGKVILRVNRGFLIHAVKKNSGSLENSISLFDDLMGAAGRALLRAAERFELYHDGEKRKLISYASWGVNQAVAREIQNSGKGNRVPVHRVEQLNALFRDMEEYYMQYGKNPSIEEIAKYTHRTVDKIKKILEYNIKFVPLEPVSHEGEVQADLYLEDSHSSDDINEIEDEITSENFAEVQRILSRGGRQVKEYIHQGIRGGVVLEQILELCEMSDRDKHIMREYFEGIKDMSDIGKDLKLTRERIRQIKDASLEMMKEVLGVNGYSNL